MNLISLLGHQEPKILTFNSPTNPSDKPLLLTVHSVDSKVGKQAFREMQSKIWELFQNEENVIEKDGQKTLKNDLLNEVSMSYIASLVSNWSGLVDDKNKKVPFNKDILIQAIDNVQELGLAIDAFSRDIEGNFQAV